MLRVRKARRGFLAGARHKPLHRWPLVALVTILMVLSWPGGPGRASSVVPPSSGVSLLASAAQSPGIDHHLWVTSTNVAPMVGTNSEFYATFPNGSIGGAFSWQFGDGAMANSSTGVAFHVYQVPGVYLVSVTAVDLWGGTFDNLAALLPVTVTTPGPGLALGNLPALWGNVTANTTSSVNAMPVIVAGGLVSVEVTTVGPVTDASTTVGTPAFSPSGGSHVGFSWTLPLNPNGTNFARVSYDLTTPSGVYPLNYTIPTSTPLNGSWLNATAQFTWDIVVGPGAAATPIPSVAPPSRSVLRVDEFGTGASTLDPALAYDRSSGEVIANEYQTLISPNGTRTGQDPDAYAPNLARCVPGSIDCLNLFGSRMVNQTNITFVLANQSFYDPLRNVSWSAYPTDVLFSIARVLAFADQPFVGFGPGYILAQALLPTGNGSWDVGVHFPYNNTPANVFASMTVNDSTFCPSSVRADSHGCVTFHAAGGGTSWPELLSLLGQSFPGSIIPCAWASARPQRAGIPYWSQGNVTGSGDQPCALPGTTDSQGRSFGVDPSAMPATGWDFWEKTATMPPYVSGLQWSMAGSGPYYLKTLQPTFGYSLHANPAYAPLRPPAPGTYIPQVNVTWTTDRSMIMSDLARGLVDVAVPPTPLPGPFLANLAATGGIGLHIVPTLLITFDSFNLNYSVGAADNLTGRNFTAPSTMFTDINLRQFLLHSLPVASVQPRAYASGGIPTRFPYAGIFANFLGGVSTANVTGPASVPDPASGDAGGAGWWWNRTAGDGIVGARCSPVSPCTFPLFYPDSDPASQALQWAWANSTRNLSGGAMVPIPLNVSFTTVAVDTLYSPPGTNPIPASPLGWAADYTDPSDFVNGLIGSSSSIAYGDAVLTQMAGLPGAGCPALLSYWSSLATPIPMNCQGVAYQSILTAMGPAHAMPIGPARSLLYNMIDQVAARLALYVPTGQDLAVTAAAPWVVPTSLESAPWFANGLSQRWDSARFTTAPATPLAVRGPVPTVDPVVIGQPVTLSAVGVGVAGGYSYSWTGFPPGCFASGPSVICAPTTSGNFSVSVQVQDGAANRVTTQVRLEVDGQLPHLLGFTVTPTPIAMNAPTELIVQVAGGTSPYSYAYSGLPPGCASANVSHLSCTPTALGSYVVNVSVTDRWGLTTGGAAVIRVIPAGTTALVVWSFAATPNPVELGDLVNFSLTATGGLSPFNWNLSGIPGCVFGGVFGSYPPGPAGTESFGCAPSAVGTFNESLNFTDSLGTQTFSRVSVAIRSPLTLSGFAASSPLGEVGASLSLNASLSGGVGPFSYVYSGLSPGCASANTLPLECTPASAGSYPIVLNVTDARNHSAVAHLSLTVNAHLAVARETASPSAVVVGDPVVLSVASVSGGVTPYRFDYHGLPPGCSTSNSAVLHCAPTVSGVYPIKVNVTDALGVVASVSATLTVTSLPGGSPGTGQLFGLPVVEAYSLLGLVLIAIVAIAVAAVVLRSRRRPPPTQGMAEESDDMISEPE